MLGLATSTVSRRVDQLETALGTRLVERSTRGLQLTEAGRMFRDRATLAEEAIEDASDAVRALLCRPAGRLRVAAPSGLVREALSAIALDYLESLPDVALEIVGTDDNVVPDGETLHVAVRISRQPAPGHLVQRVLGRIAMVISDRLGGASGDPARLAPGSGADDPVVRR